MTRIRNRCDLGCGGIVWQAEAAEFGRDECHAGTAALRTMRKHYAAAIIAIRAVIHQHDGMLGGQAIVLGCEMMAKADEKERQQAKAQHQPTENRLVRSVCEYCARPALHARKETLLPQTVKRKRR
ncbi:MAG TPA: hypothetical protein VNZ94_14385 [Xanthobacteraceae bacterium]|nr:hypothetical protein [Xanthobacteraceae bacterium]